MIAKLTAHAPTRHEALDRLTAALDRTLVAGVRSNVAFLGALCRAPEFRQGKVDTGFIDRNLAVLGAVPQGPDRAAAALGVARLLARAQTDEAFGDTGGEGAPRHEGGFEVDSPWAARDGFQLGGTRSITVPVLIDTESADATVTYGKDGIKATIDGTTPATDARVFDAVEEVYVLGHGRQTRVRLKDVAAAAAAAGSDDGVVKAPMHGRVLELFVGGGEPVAGGQRLAVIEAMKMEHTLRAPFAGVVVAVAVGAGAQVVEGAQIMVIERVAEG
jgi:3-methylcrotonyl-CoA carboxylase alpha subunit